MGRWADAIRELTPIWSVATYLHRWHSSFDCPLPASTLIFSYIPLQQMKSVFLKISQTVEPLRKPLKIPKYWYASFLPTIWLAFSWEQKKLQASRGPCSATKLQYCSVELHWGCGMGGTWVTWVEPTWVEAGWEWWDLGGWQWYYPIVKNRLFLPSHDFRIMLWMKQDFNDDVYSWSMLPSPCWMIDFDSEKNIKQLVCVCVVWMPFPGGSVLFSWEVAM